MSSVRLSWTLCVGWLVAGCQDGMLTRIDDASSADAGRDASGGGALDGALAPPEAGLDAGRDGGHDAGPPPPCDGRDCGVGARCDAPTDTCVCVPGFIDDGGGVCSPAPAGDPATRTVDEVCAAWRAGRAENASPPWEGDGSMCGPGTMSAAAIDDTLRRINVYRWLAGAPPVVDDPSEHGAQMRCAAMMSANGMLSHDPPAGWNCYDAAGAGAAQRSNIGLGYGTSGGAIDGYMEDRGVPSLGHRRWILSARLGQVGIGFARPGSRPGHCLSVFDRSGPGVSRRWSAYPNPGPTPIELAGAEWSFHSYGITLSSGVSATVVRVSDGMELPVMTRLVGLMGPPPTLAITRQGWAAEDGETYRVTITGIPEGSLSYEVQTVACR